MDGLSGLRNLNYDNERELLRKMAEAKRSAQVVVERERHVAAERRLQLETEVEIQEEKLLQLKEQARGLQEDSGRCQDGPSVADHLPELEETKATLRELHSDLRAARLQGSSDADAHQEQLEEARGIYQMYAASTGIRWDYDADHVAGCVALGSGKRFDFYPEGKAEGTQAKEGEGDSALCAKEVKSMSRGVLSEKLWQEVEASLPRAGHGGA